MFSPVHNPEAAHRDLREEFLASLPPCPGFTVPRGIVICGGGEKYLPSAWVLVNELHVLGCRLPLQLWHLGAAELPPEWVARFHAAGVECVDALEVRKTHPARILNGWEVKPYAMLQCPFREVILLDADNHPVLDPSFLFDAAPYQETGAVFWPDLTRLGPERAIWKICDVEYRDEPEFESGQMVVNKERCWRELCLTMHLNEHSDFYYQHIHGDKDTFHMAWRMCDTPYAMPSHAPGRFRGGLRQHDFDGTLLFQHRAGGTKWKAGGNTGIPGYVHWERCVAHLAALSLPPCAAPACSPFRPAAETVQRRLARYARHLGSRRRTVSDALLLLAASASRRVVELGITRSFVPGGRAGCMSRDAAFWKPDKPEAWDWGAGFFTRVAVESLQGLEFDYTGVDPSADAQAISRTAVAGLAGAVDFCLTDSETFLTQWNGRADLIYFDHGDCNEQTARQHVRDAATVIRRGLVRPGGWVLMDDHRPAPGGVPKTKYSLPLFLEAGWRVLLDAYQVLLEAPPAPQSLAAPLLTTATVKETHARLTRLWHQQSPAVEGEGIAALVTENHRQNFLIWHEEDIARRDDLPTERIVAAKRTIDRHNQLRNDAIEALDEAITAAFPVPPDSAPLHSESPGMIVDRLSIMALRGYHLEEKAAAAGTPANVQEECRRRLKTLQQQQTALTGCLETLLSQLAAGRRRFLPCRPLKLYNDSRFNAPAG